MSRPPLNPEKTVAGIALDPHTLERVIPESKRPDGTVRKQIKIRPGFTPQEDVRLFRGKKQAQMESNALPKGHIIGWAPPPVSSAAGTASGKALSKSAKKNAKRREKKGDKKETETVAVKDNWEDDDEDEGEAGKSTNAGSGSQSPVPAVSGSKEKEKGSTATATTTTTTTTTTGASSTTTTTATSDPTAALSAELSNLSVK